MKQVIAGIGLITGVGLIAGIGLIASLFLIPGSAFAYWVPDSYGQGIGPGQGPGLPGPQGGYPGDNPGGLPGLPWLGNILSGIFGNPGNPYASVYGGYPAARGIIIGGTIQTRHGSKVRHRIYRSMGQGIRLA
jgi:hypothetical protein